MCKGRDVRDLVRIYFGTQNSPHAHLSYPINFNGKEPVPVLKDQVNASFKNGGILNANQKSQKEISTV